jgi:hypothetical protein
MGKASSNKKVARAAKAGGGRARAAGERNILFPSALVVVVVLGSLLVFFARENRSADALEAPLLSDHWHSAYGFYVCGEFLPPMPEFIAPQNGGTHTHGDGLIHIHPFSSARTGQNATLGNWLDDASAILGNEGGIDADELHIPGGETFTEGDDDCDDLDGDPVVQVAVWENARDAEDGKDPDIATESLDAVRFVRDGMAFTIAFVPEGEEIPPPQTVSDLAGVGADLGVPEDSIPEDAEQTDGAEPTGEPSDTTDSDTDAESESESENEASTTTTEADADQ